MWANSSGDWGVVSTMAKGNTAVLVYPAVQQQFGANQPALLESDLYYPASPSDPKQMAGSTGPIGQLTTLGGAPGSFFART